MKLVFTIFVVSGTRKVRWWLTSSGQQQLHLTLHAQIGTYVEACEVSRDILRTILESYKIHVSRVVIWRAAGASAPE